MSASPLLGKTADQIRELLAAKTVKKSEVIAYLQGRDSLRAPSKKLLADLVGESEPTPVAPSTPAAEPRTSSYTRTRITPDLPAPSPKADYDAVVRAQGARISTLETELKTLGAVVSSLMKTVGALAATVGGEAEPVIETPVANTRRGRTKVDVLPEPSAPSPVRERTVIDPAQPPPDPTAITRGTVTKPAAAGVKVIPLSDLARAAAEDVTW